MTELSFQLRHLRLSGQRFGDPQGAKVLALHGWLDNSASFIPLAEHLECIDLVAVDLTGHGHSAHRSADAHYHLPDWIQDIYELTQSLGWNEFHLLGHSLGGIISSLYAATFPEHIKTLTTIEAFGPLSREATSSATQLRESVISRIEIDNKEARHPPSLERATTARMMAGDLARESARLLVQRNLAEDGQQLKWRTDRRLRTISSLRMTEEQATAFIREIVCPVLSITGSKGFEKVRLNQQRRASLVEKLQVAECEGGHHLHMDNPQPVAQQFLSFLREHGALD
ncbi:alpha/beta fold hydrolase [Lacimicrobium alkaliphilum]|uniref:Alpha/beta hydrolase n=1 Tax=Lacimicrobium alkaliphilum TaxID=1526571 RepID=A0ABQ1RB40_9ALTE|nr:alpha/beta hydrolase [Lacimicrobium alkaliphilum]GGD63793.1 alpha/beta hydrolase [Lacimicrobium alkaliphilum]